MLVEHVIHLLVGLTLVQAAIYSVRRFVVDPFKQRRQLRNDLRPVRIGFGWINYRIYTVIVLRLLNDERCDYFHVDVESMIGIIKKALASGDFDGSITLHARAADSAGSPYRASGAQTIVLPQRLLAETVAEFKRVLPMLIALQEANSPTSAKVFRMKEVA